MHANQHCLPTPVDVHPSIKCYFLQHLIESLLNVRPQQIIIHIGFAFPDPPCHQNVGYWSAPPISAVCSKHVLSVCLIVFLIMTLFWHWFLTSQLPNLYYPQIATCCSTVDFLSVFLTWIALLWQCQATSQHYRIYTTPYMSACCSNIHFYRFPLQWMALCLGMIFTSQNYQVSITSESSAHCFNIDMFSVSLQRMASFWQLSSTSQHCQMSITLNFQRVAPKLVYFRLSPAHCLVFKKIVDIPTLPIFYFPCNLGALFQRELFQRFVLTVYSHPNASCLYAVAPINFSVLLQLTCSAFLSRNCQCLDNVLCIPTLLNCITYPNQGGVLHTWLIFCVCVKWIAWFWQCIRTSQSY